MPIEVSIKVNEREVSVLQIARIAGGWDRKADKTHTYSVLQQAEAPQRDAEWDAGVTFTHRYGDGVEVCVQRALEAVVKLKDSHDS